MSWAQPFPEEDEDTLVLPKAAADMEGDAPEEPCDEVASCFSFRGSDQMCSEYSPSRAYQEEEVTFSRQFSPWPPSDPSELADAVAHAVIAGSAGYARSFDDMAWLEQPSPFKRGFTEDDLAASLYAAFAASHVERLPILQLLLACGRSQGEAEALERALRPLLASQDGSVSCDVLLRFLAARAICRKPNLAEKSIQKNKILRNVVTAVRRCGSSTLVQASEDLQLRLWDTRNLSKPAIAVPSGPNQLICLDVPEEGQWVACGSKGFSRENCEVKLFDLRGGLRQQAALPCADQTIEALRCADRQHVVLASKDGHLRGLSLTEPTEPKVLWERRGSSAYTALGVCDGSCLAAGAGPEGLTLELFALSDLKNAPTLLAS
ncbi:unnamed protein product [Effrenium voratum]|nr:unnamed protein product [Effrenium voratum]